MRINCLTVFPEYFHSFFGVSIAKRAVEAGILSYRAYDIRDYSVDKHRRTDDYPFGGGAGMVMTPQPIFDCFYDVLRETKGRFLNVYMSPKGKPFTAQMARWLAGYDTLNILCGHYEGIDQRALDEFIQLEVSIGDYVLTGGELPACILIDAAMRFIPGVLGNGESSEEESFCGNLLEYPQYTRPADYRGRKVPDVLLNGHHANIQKWRRQQALKTTARNRPDLLKKADLTREEQEFLKKLDR